jgi:hypothetical protein
MRHQSALLRIRLVSFGYKRGVGKAAGFKAPLTSDLNSSYGVQPAGSRHVVEEVYFQYNIIITGDADRKSVVWGYQYIQKAPLALI